MSSSFKLFYDYFSPLSRALLILFERNNVKCEKIAVALRKGEHLSDDFARDVNRFQRVPVIHDSDGFRLAESVAIFHYLGRRGYFDERWYPKSDFKRLARLDEFLQWNHNSLLFSTALIFYEAWLKPIREDCIVEHGMMRSVREPLTYVDIHDSLERLENVWLKSGRFLVAGDDGPSFAELISSCALMQVIGLRLFALDERKYPRVAQWLSETKSFFNPEFDECHKFVYKYGEALQGRSPFA